MTGHPQDHNAKGSEITQKDGVWENKIAGIRAMVCGGKFVIGMNYSGAVWASMDILRGKHMTLISTDPADLLNGWKGGPT